MLCEYPYGRVVVQAVLGRKFDACEPHPDGTDDPKLLTGRRAGSRRGRLLPTSGGEWRRSNHHRRHRDQPSGGKIIPQLWHVGTQRPVGSLPNPEALLIGPSGLTVSGEKVNEPMTGKEIEAVSDAYAQGAADAKRLGFDGIELHGAHSYLIDQFFWEKTNRRTDRYGGDLVARTRFAVEVIEACRRAVGSDFPIVFPFSQWEIGEYTAKLAETPEELARFLAPLADAGVDVFHCSTRRFWEPEFEGSDLNLAGWTKKLTGKPTITVGSVGLDADFTSLFTEGKGAGNANIDGLLDRLERGEFDLVAVARFSHISIW